MRGGDVVARLVEGVAVADRVNPGDAGGRALRPLAARKALALVAQHEELGFHAEVHLVAHLRRALHLAGEDVARARLEGLSLVVEVAREERHLLVPRQDEPVRDIGVRGHLLVVDLLGHAVERRARIELGAFHHLIEMRERNNLPLQATMKVHIARKAEAHALLLECFFYLRGFTCKQIHDRSFGR